ncbi:hypothetical protein NI18_19395, partial [Sphingomonas sp. Ant20]
MRSFWLGLGAFAASIASSAPAQVRTIDPNQAIDGDLAPQTSTTPSRGQQVPDQRYPEPAPV